jgi:predicted esterase
MEVHSRASACARAVRRVDRFHFGRTIHCLQCILLAGLVAFSPAIAPAISSAADTVTLKNGMHLEGSFGNIASVGGTNPLAALGSGGVQLKRIVVCDDNLRRTFVGTNQLAGTFAPATGSAPERFLIPQRESLAGRGVAAVGPILRITPFDEHGRRIFSMSTPDGRVDVVQGITEITPTYCKVTVVGGGPFVWQMSIATAGIPRETLSKILKNYTDPKSADDRLKIVKLFIQAERIQDARAELDSVIKDFPGLAALQSTANELTQMAAQRLIKEIELRRDAGQPQLAIAMLQNFPSEGVAGVTLLKVREILESFQEIADQGTQIKARLDANLTAVKDEKLRDELAPLVNEIKTDLTIHNVIRLNDFVRLSTDGALTAEQKLSLAVSGWILGRDSGLENLAVSKSLIQVRELVREYLRTTRQAERDAILAQLTSLEGATPAYIAKIIAHLRPPLEPMAETEAAADPADIVAAFGPPKPPVAAIPAEAPAAKEKEAPEEAPRDAQPANAPPPAAGRKAAVADDFGGLLAPSAARQDAGAGAVDALEEPAAEPPAAEAPEVPAADAPVAGATDIPGMFSFAAAGLPEHPQIKYTVQLPPEYSPYRRYPCIVTLNGGGTTPEQQIAWWAGDYKADSRQRYGQASRHGYIVIAPDWLRPHQREYEYSAREHAAALFTLRDACKRFSIDTDRVFLSGHSLGGDAAWDIGIAHPDLWAGVIPIVATSDKHVGLYWENAKNVSFYFVCGEKDGDKMARNSTDWNRYFERQGFDTMVVQFQGRGHEHFHDEILRIFEWMNLHRRDFFPKEIDIVTLRPWDTFFWWLEASGMPANLQVLPVEWPKRDLRRPETKGNVAVTGTSVRVNTPAKKVTVWLAPELVNFDEKVSVTINNRAQRNITPSIGTLLEDARTRGDRQHPFWARVDSQQ